MRNEVAEKTKITISAGIAPNGRLAKIASNKNKPNGQYRVASDRTAIMAFMRDLPVRKLNGVGRVFERELDAIGIKTCGDIFDHRAYLARLFGDKAFQFLMNCYLGLGRTRIQPAEEYERKSVGTESTFRDMSGADELRDKLRRTAEELSKDLARTQFKGRTLVLKIKLYTYEVYTRQVVLPKAMHAPDELYHHALPMLTKLEKEIPGLKLRLMGLRVTNLVSMKKAGAEFFGLRASSPYGQASKRKASAMDDDGTVWELWPEDEVEAAGESEEQTGADPAPHSTPPPDSPRRHGKERTPNPKKQNKPPEKELWDCPICQRPQPADDKQFNDHVDYCLSRQTIKEVIHDASKSIPPRLGKTISFPERSSSAVVPTQPASR